MTSPQTQIEKLQKEIVRQQQLVEVAKTAAQVHPIFAHPRTLFYNHTPYCTGYEHVMVRVENDAAALALIATLDVQPAGMWEHGSGKWARTFLPYDHGRKDKAPEWATPAMFQVKASGIRGEGAFTDQLRADVSYRTFNTEIICFVHMGELKIEVTIRIENSNLYAPFIKHRTGCGSRVKFYHHEYPTLQALAAAVAK